MDPSPIVSANTLLAQAQREKENGAVAAFEALFTRYAGVVRQSITSSLIDHTDAESLEKWVKGNVLKNVKRCDSPERSFENLVRSRCILALLRHFSEPSHHDAARQQELAAELRDCPGFPSCGSSDEAILASEARRRPEAFSQLWELNHRVILGCVRIRTRNDEDAREILQDTCLSLLKSGIQNFDPTVATFRTFAKSHAEGRCKRFYSRRKSRREIPLEDPGDHPGGTESGLGVRIEVEDLGPSPEMLAYYSRLEHILFRLANPPHQLIVYGFRMLLEFEPRQIVAELSPSPLLTLEAKLEMDYARKLGRTLGEIAGTFQEMNARLALPGVGEIPLEKHLSEWGDSSVAIYNWVSRVKQALYQQILRPAPGDA